jgi:signal transduction histidine kinase
MAISLAHTWFSSYVAPESGRPAALVVDSSEEMRVREEQALRRSMHSNHLAATAVAHELRNLCGAISLLCSSLQARSNQMTICKVFTLWSADWNESARAISKAVPAIPWRKGRCGKYWDDLRLVIEPDWREIHGAVLWCLPSTMPMVLAERHVLFQAFLNLAPNSQRAARACAVCELSVDVSIGDGMARGPSATPGPAWPTRNASLNLSTGADGSGLGLDVSRAMVRSYGGELRFEPHARGTCFTVEISVV